MDFRLPELGEGVYEAELVEWKVRPGDVVRPAQTLAEVMTDKAVMDLPSPFDGTVSALSIAPGTEVKVGEVILSYEPSSRDVERDTSIEPDRNMSAAVAQKSVERPVPAAAQAKSRPADSPPRDDGPAPRDRVPASPSVRRMAQRLGIDLATLRGSGPGGRILIDDLAPTPAPPDRPAPPNATAAAPRRGPSLERGTPGARVAFHGMRRKIAERMVHSARTIPHYAYVDECDVSDLVRIRDSLRDAFAERGVKLTYLAFVVRAVALALKDVPFVNSSLDEEAGEIVLHDRTHVGVATATPRGLVVPVLRDADRLSLEEIARRIERLSGEARSGQLRPEDLAGGTFTVTSIGGFGGLIATPVINHPETAIMAVGRVVKRPVYDAAGRIRPADMLYLSFSFDHRVIDGAVGVEFGNAVIRRLANPAQLLLSDERSGNEPQP